MRLPIKNEFGAGILELSRMATTEYMTGSKTVSDKPCWVLSVVTAMTNTNTGAILYLRNGETILSDILLNWSAKCANPSHNAPYPLYFNRGLYVELNTNVAGVTVQYLQDSP